MSATPPPSADPDATPAGRAASGDGLDAARDVLRHEAASLHALADALDGPLAAPFSDAVERIARLSGRVVVSGIGKSGHVARKIAATLASTGTPALFVHPAEASHGDLGMVLEGDLLLLVSRGGETAELADLVAHGRRFGLPILAVTARLGSTLARAADVVLALPPCGEACAVTAAPTTSTTMQMALGDALAVTLLRRRGFTASDFGLIHPGGSLGARLRRVSDLMRTGDAMPLAAPDTKLLDAVLLMTRKALGCVGVVDADGRLAGIVTDGDLRRAIDRDLRGLTAGAIMTRAPRTIRPDRLAVDALRMMNADARPVLSLFALDESGVPVGIVHIHDLLRTGIA